MLAVGDALTSIRFSMTEDFVRRMMKAKGMQLNKYTRQGLRIAVRRVVDDSVPVLVLHIAAPEFNPPPHHPKITQRKRLPNWYDFTISARNCGIVPAFGRREIDAMWLDDGPNAGMLWLTIPDECWVHTVREVDIERLAIKKIERQAMTEERKRVRRNKRAAARAKARKTAEKLAAVRAHLDARAAAEDDTSSQQGA